MILEKIVNERRIRIEAEKKENPLEVIRKRINERGELSSFTGREIYSFEKVLQRYGAGDGTWYGARYGARYADPIKFICEVKKASPSKGIIAKEFPYLSIAKEYEDGGASAISVLTEAKFFLGSSRYLEEISRNVGIPVLRKDFIIDEYQIYESKLMGADALLLICSLLSLDELKEYLDITNSLGMTALVEAHTEEEVDKALSAGARIIGVNNRNLDTFEVDLQNSIHLRAMVPDHITFVAESGIRSAEDINTLAMAGVDAVLIGETLMKSKDRLQMIRELRGK